MLKQPPASEADTTAMKRPPEAEDGGGGAETGETNATTVEPLPMIGAWRGGSEDAVDGRRRKRRCQRRCPSRHLRPTTGAASLKPPVTPRPAGPLMLLPSTLALPLSLCRLSDPNMTQIFGSHTVRH